MNPKIYESLETMKKYIGNYDEHRIALSMAEIFVLLTEEVAMQGEKAEKQAEKVIGLTKALRTLTVVLVIVSIIQIGLMVKSLF